jgi:signal transduction histidine kinase
MQADQLRAPISEGAAGTAGGPAARAVRGRGFDAARFLSMQIAIWAMLGFGTTVIWAAAGGGYYWPAWVWFGFGIPIALNVSLRWAWAQPKGFKRRISVQAALSGVLWGSEVTAWAFAGRGATFWPVYSGTVYLVLLGLHAAIWGRIPPEREAVLSARIDQLTRTRRGALDVQAAELRRIERDLHDGAQARLVALSMQLGIAEDKLSDQPEIAAMFRRARDEASAAIAELRDLARGIAPPILADRGLEAAAQALGRRSAIPVEVEADVPWRPLPVIETAAYFVVAEGLTNVAKHAPQASARVTLDLDTERLLVVIADDGPGGADAGGGGLTGLRHRVEALDGRLTVTSPPGGGTAIRAELPCGS